ncbi:MAG: hypothetical protein H8J66_01435 [Nitrospira sp.]|nr:hypothetical protein [Nitrospira sp.]
MGKQVNQQNVADNAQVLAAAILGADVPAELLYGIVDVVVKDNPAVMDDAAGFEFLCWLQLETEGVEGERLALLNEARQLWRDPAVRALAIETVRTRCHEELALNDVE